MKYHLVLTKFSEQFINVQFTKDNKSSPSPWKCLTSRFLFFTKELPIYLCALVETVEMEIHFQQMRA